MLATFEILLPIFALILAGFVCRKRRVLGPTAASELNKFVVWLALPSLLFDVMAHATWVQLDQPGFIATFGITSVGFFALVLVVRMLGKRHLADASIDAIAASYPNVGYIGFPLALLLFGAASRTPTTIAAILVACIQFAVAIVMIEIGLQTERQPIKLALKVLKSLAKNPLIFSPVMGAVVAACRWTLPASAETFLTMLSSAASPCALISLGLFLAEKRPSAGLQWTSVWLSVLKLIVQPALAWLLAAFVFRLSPDLVAMSVVLAALPTGTGPFMLAEFYRREAVITSQTILVTTVFSLITVTAMFVWLGH